MSAKATSSNVLHDPAGSIVPVAALYKVSTTKQLKEGEDVSIPVQAAVIREFVSKHSEWQLVKEYFLGGRFGL